MKKKIVTRSIKILSLLLVLLASVWVLQEFVLCHADHNRQRVKGFYLEDKNSLDVVIIGASEVYADYSACHAYEKFGFTSYPMATQSNLVCNYKHQLKEIRKHQNPKLILVEVNGALYGNDEKFGDGPNFRNYADHVPLTFDKLELINQNAPDDKLEYILPIIKYHSVWEDFPDGLGYNVELIRDRFRGHTYLRGTKTKSRAFKPTAKVYNEQLVNDETRKDLSPLSEKYLIEFLEYCKEENIENIAFVRFPHIIVNSTVARYYRGNTLGDIIEEYGYDYINCEKDFFDIGFDINKDFYDVEHLNVNGQRKFTEYLGNIIQNEYGVTPTDLTPEQKSEWDLSLKYYHAFCKYNEDLMAKGVVEEINEDYHYVKEIEKYLE